MKIIPKRKKSILGQALIETYLITIFLIIVCFATFQLIMVVITDMTYNEAIFSASRTAIVSREDSSNNKAVSAIFYCLTGQMPFSQIRFLPSKTEEIKIDGQGNNKIRQITLQYLVKIIFGSFFKPFGLDMTHLYRKGNIRMVLSPDSEYYDKGYPGASSLGENLPADIEL